MRKLIEGLHQFQNDVFRPQREFFEGLGKGQRPESLFITCSDSRISPNLLTQTQPGELFILRNAGNIIPPYGAVHGGEEATIEYAVAALGVRDIIVCGHSHCGAMNALLQEADGSMPAVARWLGHAEATRRIMRQSYQHLTDGLRLTTAVEQNVLVQLENLKTHAAVAAALSLKALQLHGWVYKIETGEVFAFDPGQGRFVLLVGGRAGAESGPVKGPTLIT